MQRRLRISAPPIVIDYYWDAYLLRIAIVGSTTITANEVRVAARGHETQRGGRGRVGLDAVSGTSCAALDRTSLTFREMLRLLFNGKAK